MVEHPEKEKEVTSCLMIPCSECPWHVTKDGKLDCNKNNRLGLAKPVLGSFMSKETNKDVLKARLEVKKKELEEMEKALGEVGK